MRSRYERERSTYRNMMSRCFNPKATGYENYGGRGIMVCKRWRNGFKYFLEDMGRRPPKKSLDRIDYDGDYTPENCRWATFSQQARNTRANRIIEFEGRSMCLDEWGKELGIIPNTILTRIRRGWPVAQALEKEERPKKLYNGRLTDDEVQYVLASTKTQIGLGEELGIHPSQISRVIKIFTENINRKDHR